MTHSLPVPLDVKLMNLTASLLVAVLALGGIAAGLWWFARHPAFAIRQITVDGDTTHNSAASLRPSVAPRLQGTFFTIDLAAVQSAFQSAPWVQSALVRREFPNQLHVTLHEYVPVAHWGQDDERMVNGQGDVFEAPGVDSGQSDADELPTLIGPNGEAPEVLAMYRRLQPLAAPLGTGLNTLALQSRGNWQLELDTGAVVELGLGPSDLLAARFRQFVATAKEVAARYQRSVEDIESADLRHVGGYALRLRGVSTVDAPTDSRPAPAAATRNRTTRQ